MIENKSGKKCNYKLGPEKNEVIRIAGIEESRQPQVLRLNWAWLG